MSLSLLSPSSPTTGAGASALVQGAVVGACVKPRLYLIIHCHPGWKEDLGRVLENAARTHEDEVRTNSFPNLPVPEYVSGCDSTRVVYCNNVDTGPVGGAPTDRPANKRGNPAVDNYTESLQSIVDGCADDSIVYLAIYAHSGWLRAGSNYENAIFFHPTSQVWANFTGSDLPVFKPGKFTANSQVRIFGCYAGYGSNSIAEQIAAHLPSTDVYAFNWDGGAIGTNDKEIGHGKKNVPSSPPDPRNGPTWFVTFSPGRKSVFRSF